MNIDNIRNEINNIVNDSIYKSDDNLNLDNIIMFFKNNKNILEDLKYILKDRTNENNYYYDNILIKILTNISKDIKLNILYNSDIYIDIFKNQLVLLRIWQTLSKKDKVKYINDKNKCNDIDFYIINEAIGEKTNYKENFILKEIVENEKVRNKIPEFTLDVKYSPSTINNIDLSNYELCSKFTKNSYTNLVIKSCSILNDFKDLVESDNRLINLIERNRIIFKNTENKYIVEYLKNNLDMIGLFNNKYLNYFTNEEIENIYNNKNISNDTFSSIIEKMYKLHPNRANELFSVVNLERCVKHSLDVYPFAKLDDSLCKEIMDNHRLFNRFIDTIMIEAISDKYSEEEITNMLRNPVFIKDQSAYSIQLLLNKLSFKTVFNMLQSKDILDMVTCLNTKISSNDKIFIKGFIDSPSLVKKTDHAMLNELLLNIDDDILYYLDTPYISSVLTNDEIIELCLSKNIKIEDIINSYVLKNKLNKDDIITFIDRSWETNIDLSIFNNKDLVGYIFNINKDIVDKIDFNEVNYLFESIKMKSILSKQESKYTILTYKSVMAAYLTFGVDLTMEIVNKGNMDLTLDNVLALKDIIVNEKVERFKLENSSIIQNIHNKVDNNIRKIDASLDINDFAKALKRNVYLDNVMYLMLENNYKSYNNILETFYDYATKFDINPYGYKKELYEYCNNFIKLFVDNKVNEFNKEFENKILCNYKLRESVIYNKRKAVYREFINKKKIEVFVDTLTKNKLDYIFAFNKNVDINNIKEDYINYLNIDANEFDKVLDNILIPLSLGCYDKERVLSKLDIIKPKEYDLYKDYNSNVKDIEKLNKEIDKLKDKYSNEEVLKIMEGILYENDKPITFDAKDRKVILKLNNIVDNIDGEVYIDKKLTKFKYGNRIDIYNEDSLIKYDNYVKIIDEVVSKTNTYLNKHLNTKNIEDRFRDEYIKNISLDSYNYPINNKYYELKKRVLCLKDIEKVFNGYKLYEYRVINDELRKFLLDNMNLVLVAEGYYDGVVDNLGLIINNFDNIYKEYDNVFPYYSFNLINASKLLNIINFELDTISKSIEYDIIKSIMDDDYYIDTDVKDRLANLQYIYKNSFKKVSSSVPYIKFEEKEYEVSIVDNYNQDIYRYAPNTNYRIGARGNDFLHYVLLNKNGIKVLIKKNGKIIASVLGVRNGNCLYLNKLEGIKDDNYEHLLSRLGSEIINITRFSNEPIEFITILVNKLLDRSFGIRIDNSLCPIIDNPINTSYSDFIEFRNSRYLNTLNNDIFYTNYKEKIDTILSSSQVIDKNNFKYYDAEDKYLRNRNNVIKLSNNIEDYYIYKINTIINLCKEENVLEFDGDIKLSTIDTIYLGDDFVIFITYRRQLIKYVLPYDMRAINEVKLIIDSLK